MRAPSFTVAAGIVHWNGVRLPERSVERLLDLFEDLGDQPAARDAFNELYDAQLQAGGIPRCTSLRLVSGGAG